MRLKCKNIGRLQSADIDIRTTTVIAGLNSTGKSTVGKLLYCIFNSSHDIKNAIEQNLLLIISRYLESSLFGLTIPVFLRYQKYQILWVNFPECLI